MDHCEGVVIHLNVICKWHTNTITTAFVSLTANKPHPFLKHAECIYVGERYHFSREAVLKEVKFRDGAFILHTRL